MNDFVHYDGKLYRLLWRGWPGTRAKKERALLAFTVSVDGRPGMFWVDADRLEPEKRREANGTD